MQGDILQQKAAQLRRPVPDTYEAGRMDHIASSFSCIEIMTALFYGSVMRFRSSKLSWEQRDRFLLSKGHARILYYSVLADLGYFTMTGLCNYGKQGSHLGVHVDYCVPGVDASCQADRDD